MIATEKKLFDRDEQARLYAGQHLKTDPGTRTVYYLPTNALPNEIRLLEINDMMAERENDVTEPIDFGVQIGGADAHTLLVLDITPSQWERIRERQLPLPAGWSLEGAISFSR